jgi:hypothetical protein
MENPIDGTDRKLGRDKPRPTFISANLDSGFRGEWIRLLKEYKIASLGIIRRCLVSIVLLLSIGCQSSLVINLTSNLPRKFTRMKYWPT